MSVTIQMVALGRWENRANLNYVPVNSALPNGARYNAFGISSRSATDPGLTRRPYKIEEAEGVSYIMYDDDAKGDVAIFKVAEA